jgi:hypothetical protein
MKPFLLYIILSFAAFSTLPAQSRGIDVVVGEAFEKDATIGKRAVFIAIDRYQEWEPLSNPVRDAKEIRNILKGQYFIDEVRELYDQVFVFYAGHGQTDIITDTGNWIPMGISRERRLI